MKAKEVYIGNNEILDRYLLIVDILKKNKDWLGLELLEDLVKSCKRYRDVTYAFLNNIAIGGATLKESDETKWRAHQVMMDALAIFQRYFKKKYKEKMENGEIPEISIYTGKMAVGTPEDPSYRRALGEWGIDFANSIESLEQNETEKQKKKTKHLDPITLYHLETRMYPF